MMVISSSQFECHNFPLVDSKMLPISTFNSFVELLI